MRAVPAYSALIILGTPKDALLEANLRGVRLRSILEHGLNWSPDESCKVKPVRGVLAMTDADPTVLDSWLREGLGRKPAPGDLMGWGEVE